MADWSPWYTTGTVAIANAGTTATGVGTNFHTAGIRAGDLITNAAMTAWAVVTAAPTTPTQLAITAWGGAALPAGSPYRILRISDADRLIGAHADLMAALVPNLTALGSLLLAANKGIYATGLNTLETYDLTPFARTLLASADARAAADKVTAGSTTITAAATTDLGSAASVYVNVSGTATITSFGTGSVGAVRFVVFTGGSTLVHSGSLILPGSADIATEGSDTAIFVCGGSGAAWRCLSYTRRGASPGGISYGTGAGAHWLRLGNVSGVQLCWGKHTRSGVPANLSSPTFFRTASQGRSFPAAFASADVAVGVFVFPSTSGQYDIWASQAVAQSGTTMSYVVLSGTSRASIDWTEYWWALGRY